jgi:hypothetical protein
MSLSLSVCPYSCIKKIYRLSKFGLTQRGLHIIDLCDSNTQPHTRYITKTQPAARTKTESPIHNTIVFNTYGNSATQKQHMPTNSACRPITSLRQKERFRLSKYTEKQQNPQSPSTLPHPPFKTFKSSKIRILFIYNFIQLLDFNFEHI